MKMTNETFTKLQTMLAAADRPKVREAYRNRLFPRADQCSDVNMRYRWDLFHHVMRTQGGYAALPELHNLLDSHIDTALRKIIQDVE